MQITIRVIPRSSRNTLEWEQGQLKARLTAAPVDGAANAALLALLAERLALPRRSIRLVHGATGRQKVVSLEGLSPEEVEQRVKQSKIKR
ncbi:DUF167 domain-containing protein [Ktedonosporobacter rubrisoli]|uniref:UPF0235 protein EPA93_37290 n=1 Tax=Ktedonosporobacter rubrisoli TaxID=2509675 RepID=A0A4P6K101_KTERU|nr:DUF167 family protein [Ktedonosporobacter rubrisoli]QBD81330.1 DUF167 domain-containing protein [Ktedonosporobacter rubrisoli]